MNVCSKGDLLELKTVNEEIFVGRLHSLKSDKTSLMLRDVTKPNSDKLIKGPMTFFAEEILKIRVKKEPDPSEGESREPHALRLTHEQTVKIKHVSEQFVFVDEADGSFREAVRDLEMYAYVGVGTEGVGNGRRSAPSVLTVSTPERVYVFDVQKLQAKAFDSGLKRIFEGGINKIVHDCRSLSDYLHHRHGVQLKNVFDTQVADVQIYRNKHGEFPSVYKTFPECLSYHLGLDNDAVQQVSDECLQKRPMATKTKEILSRNNIYLHHLSEVLQEDMLSQFRKGVNYFMNCLRQCSEFDFEKSTERDTRITDGFKVSSV